nr:sialin-like [Procambarus clarkii]
MTTAKRATCEVPARVTLAMLTSLGVVSLYLLRINMSVAIVAMVYTPPTNGATTPPTNASTTPPTNARNTYALNAAFCTTYNQVNQTAVDRKGDTEEAPTAGGDVFTSDDNLAEEEKEVDLLADKMVLTATQRGLVLGAFFYGYFVTNIPGGRLAEVYGTKRVFGGAILVGGVLTLFTPLAARAHYGALILLRVLIGLAHGVVYPAMNVMVARWVPPLERPRFMSFTYMSNTLGTIITLPLCAVIIAWAGWAAVFYVTGAISLVWVALWAVLMHDSPQEHPSISSRERDYILQAIKKGTTQHKPRNIPWRSILTSGPLWATHIAHIGSMFGFNLLLTQLPTYMDSVLGFSIKTNGLLSALPFLTQFLGSLASGVVGDWFLTRRLITLNASRKLFATTSLVVPGVVLVAVGYVGCRTTLAVALFPIGTAFSGAICSGHLANHLDLAPNLAGTALGVSNTLAYMVSMCVPVVVGVMTPNNNLEEWQSVFWLTAIMYVSTWLVFVVFGSTDIQPWNYQEAERPKPSGEETSFLATEQEAGRTRGEETSFLKIEQEAEKRTPSGQEINSFTPGQRSNSVTSDSQVEA